jgi:hypothetical protein
MLPEDKGFQYAKRGCLDSRLSIGSMFVQEQQSRRQLVDVSWHVLGGMAQKGSSIPRNKESQKWGGSMVMVVPQARWMVYFMEILLKWMMKWGTIFQETYINLGKL